MKGSEEVLRGIKRQDLYTIEAEVVSGLVDVASTKPVSKTELWHMILGHVSERGLIELGKKTLLGGDKVEKQEFCKPGVFGKSCRVKFNRCKQKTHGSLYYIHAYLWGPTRNPSHSCARYFLSIIDDYSRKLWKTDNVVRSTKIIKEELKQEEFPVEVEHVDAEMKNLDEVECVATEAYINKFSPIQVNHLSRYGSDHAAVRIETEVDRGRGRKKRRYIFRFEEVWSRDPKCEEYVNRIWNNPSTRGHHKLAAMKKLEVVFKDYKLGSTSKEIHRVEEMLSDGKNWDSNEESMVHFKRLEKRKDDLLHVEEIMWRQRSRALWLQHGDRNTKFFHGKANQRRKTNNIKKLKDEAGCWRKGEEHCERILVNYFSELFASSLPTNIQGVCSVVKGKLKEEHIRWCTNSFTALEVKEALLQMAPLKAPGPDGLPALFFQKYWSTVGSDVTNLALEILNNNKNPGVINDTHIALIPKCKNPSSPKDFRPISLCNVVMKVITKTIANRIKCILPEIIDEEQSAFVKGRLITDNALVAMECFHWMKKKTKGKRGVMALKLDMSKAYDRLEWDFVTEVLSSMGFPASMVTLIRNCISTVSYKVLINGQPSVTFSPERGLRQGDPLSPYLFILCFDVFSGLIKHEAAANKIHGISVARKAPVITHLFFADDCLLFARENSNEAGSILNLLQQFQESSGQMVSLEKSELSFSRNVRVEEKDALCLRMGVRNVMHHSKYLGLPVVFGKSKKEVFALVIERVWKKLKGWKEQFLSRAGKEILIKAVAQAIPSYIMSCYRLPETTCKELEAMLASFWWGSKHGKRKIHWMSWEKMARSKQAGGMGFRGISEFNTSLLGKHYWRLLDGDHTLVGKIFKGRYYPRCSIDESSVGFNPSYAWRSILSARDLIQHGARWRIGNGEKVDVRKDGWLPDNPGFKISGSVRNLAPDAKVSSLIDRDLGIWKRDLIFNSFDTCVASQIVSIPLALRQSEDTRIWHHEKNGEYSVRSAYHICMHRKAAISPGPSGNSQQRLWKEIWKAPIHNRTRNFLWRLARNILPSKENLRKKGIALDCSCAFCHQTVESSHHLFMNCDFTRQVFFASILCYRIPTEVDLNVWLLDLLTCGDMFSAQLSASLLYKIWCARNKLMYQQKPQHPVKVANEALDSTLEYNRWNVPASRTGSSLMQPQTVSMPVDTQILQVDAGLIGEEAVSFGCVLKNHDSRITFAASHRECVSVEPAVAEMLAIRWSLTVASKLSLQRLIVQSDAKVVVDCINGTINLANLELLADDCRMLLKNFDLASVLFLNRNCNSDAHNVAELGKLYGSKTWING
ncbi:uncharacterized protein LOC131596076 [Vicia villosa]|uniref:uncharacterized protein LOC131596076 n=1 Tax=Vicia villosa TaxID=3911 RepID=UPI00273C6714|nr:uncharacterized protein LOC131596076 [Vicia villosa]